MHVSSDGTAKKQRRLPYCALSVCVVLGNLSSALSQPKREYQGATQRLIYLRSWSRYLGQVSKQTGVHIPPCIDVEGVTMLSRLVLPQSGLGGYQTPLSQGRRGTADTSLCFHGTYHCIPLSHRQRNVGENIIAKQACPNIEARQPRWRDALDKRRAARSPQRGARAASNLLEKLFLYRAHLVRCLGTKGEVQFNMEVNWKSSTRPASLRVKSTCKTLSLCRYKPFSSKRA
ncbi:hypothetical protein MCOR27_008418 [Pyricularia oryzae]|uniref:Secreted protein n=1 Tax=Pyricularia grisea TaxID=148305 RepID=A0ABQ8N1Z3_PYRGI|nr:hypothetical protein MCOR01_001055 [Pyricularia oryzae]KAI6289858.1 hypothetical protein MCOR33_011676 [Pyricularia grisea]KAI6251703.1 hypothetical protein MCOR19_011662 [Pyricularia oryzae]KAI6267897.1 hypothetical protein MCOR26_009464 [Pyricularia oryzae]KAI6272307.1 hypothetical protein MCOR27_008418 [Pyricularia oryzae]